MSSQDTYRRHAFKPKMAQYETNNFVFDSCPGIQNYAFQNSKLHVSLAGPCFISVQYKGIDLQGSFCTQITPEFTHHHKHSTLECFSPNQA